MAENPTPKAATGPHSFTGPDFTGPDPFTAPGRFWRGNLHCHSNRSDGALPPAEVCRRYAAEGYDFLALTDHFLGLWSYPIVDTSPYRQPGFTTLLGAELHAGAMENGALWHILAVGLPADFAPPDSPDFTARPGQETGPAIAARARAAGAFVALAHPHWSGLTEADAASLAPHIHAIEAYNHGCATGADRGQGFACAEQLFARGHRLGLIATDDAHFNEPDHFGGWLWVKAEENTPEALLAALKAGHYYASQGPEIYGLRLADGVLEITCSAVVSVIVQGAGVAARALHGVSMTRARLDLGDLAQSPWLRVTVIDAAGRRAWSNPYWRSAP